MLAHAEACQDCAGLNETMRNALSHALIMGEAPVPEAASAAWRKAVHLDNAASTSKRPQRSARWMQWGAVAAMLLVLMGLTAWRRGRQDAAPQAQVEMLSLASAPLNGAGPPLAREAFPLVEEAEPAPDASLRLLGPASPDEPVLFAAGEFAASTARPAGTMLERSARVSLHTQQFDADAEKLLRLPEQMEGWVERQFLSGQPYADAETGRLLSLTLRIPEAKLEEALATLAGIGTLETKETYAQDISEQYVDTQGRLDSALSLRTQLLALMARAEDVETLAALTRELSENQQTIDALQGALHGMDSRVQYSEVSVTLAEQRPGGIAPAQGASLGSRISQGFVESINTVLAFLGDMVSTLVWLLPWAVMVGAVVWLVLWLVRKRKRK